MRYIAFLGLFACLFLNCNVKTSEPLSVFLQTPQDKGSLLSSGYSHPKLSPKDTAALSFPPQIVKSMTEMREQNNQNTFTRSKGDTTIAYIFRNKDLIYIVITIPLVRVDTVALFRLLDMLGFSRTDGASNLQSDFQNKEANIRYRMTFTSRIVEFVNNVANMHNQVIPPADSARSRQ